MSKSYVNSSVIFVCRNYYSPASRLDVTCCVLTEMLSEAVKMLKGEYTLRAIDEHNMEKAIVFCRTKLDCDNMEAFFNKRAGGE